MSPKLDQSWVTGGGGGSALGLSCSAFIGNGQPVSHGALPKSPTQTECSPNWHLSFLYVSLDCSYNRWVMLEQDFCNNSEIFGRILIVLVIKLSLFRLLCWPLDQLLSVILVLECRLLPVQDVETACDHIQGETKAENKPRVKYIVQ